LLTSLQLPDFPTPHSTLLRRMQAIPTTDGRYVRAFAFDLAEVNDAGRPFAFSQAVHFLRIHEVKKYFRQTKSLLELADDVASTCYDPGDGRNRRFVLYALANILEPERLGLMQMVGVRGFGADIDHALARAERDALAMRGVMEGKYRQIRMEPLTIEESVVFYEHLKRCRSLGAILGHPVPRIAAGHGDMNLRVRFNAQEMQEQLEIIAAACAEIPFLIMTWVDPLRFEEITNWLTLTARELSKWKSEVQGTKSIHLAAIIPSLFRPTFDYVSDSGRRLDALRSARYDHLHRRSDLTHLYREAVAERHELDQDDHVDYESRDHTARNEDLTGHENGHRDVHEQGAGREALDRVSHESWLTRRDVSAVETGTRRSMYTQTLHQRGDVSEAQHLDEHEQVGEDVHAERQAEFTRDTNLTEQIHEQTRGQEHRSVRDEYGYRENYGGHETADFSGQRHAAGTRAGVVTHDRTGDEQVNRSAQEMRLAGGTQHQDGRRASLVTDAHRWSNEHEETDGHRETRGMLDTKSGMDDDHPDVSITREEKAHGPRAEGTIRLFGMEASGGGAQHDNITATSRQTHRVESRGLDEGYEDHRDRSAYEDYGGHEFSSFDDRKDYSEKGWQAAVSGERSSVRATGRDEYGDSYRVQENFGGHESRSIAGSRHGSGVRTDEINLSFDRRQDVDRQTHAHLTGTEQRSEDVTRAIDRETTVDRGIERNWDLTQRNQAVENRAWTATVQLHSQETGVRDARVQEFTQRQWESDVEQDYGHDFTRQTQADIRTQSEGESDTTLHRQGEMQAERAGSGREVTQGPTDARLQAQGVSALTTQGARILSGFGSAGMPYMSASVGKTMQTFDEYKRLVVTLLEKQLARLQAAQDTGLFHTHCWIGAYNDGDLTILGNAVVGALREESVVAPIMVRTFDKERQEDLHQHLLCLHPCPEKETIGIMQMGVTSEMLTSNELGALTHPLRIDAHGGISTTVEAIPTTLRVPVHMKGETAWGWIVSPATGKVTRNQFRVPVQALMHLTCVGGSGSGKSNAAQWILAEIMNRCRVDETGRQIPARVRQVGPYNDIPDLKGDHGKPMLGATVFDPGGDWRRLALMVDPREVSFYSLTNPNFRPLYFNPLRIPSPYISPNRWAELVAKRWAIAYATGSTGFHAIKTAILHLYRERGVYVPRRGIINIEASADLRMTDLYDTLSAMRDEKRGKRSKQDISVGVLDRILEKMYDFTPEVGGEVYEMYSAHPGTTVEVWMAENQLTILEGSFEDDNLKAFIIALMGNACYLHAKGRYEAHGHRTTAFAPHILVFEEAHEVMESDERRMGDAASAVEKGTTIWNKMFDQGRKFGLHVWGIGQRLSSLPKGLLSSSRITIIMGIDDEDDIKPAVVKMAKVTSAFGEDVPWMRFFQRMPVGYGVIKFSRMPRWVDQEPVLLKFPEIKVEPPANAELDYILDMAPWLYAGDSQEAAQVMLDRLRKRQPMPRIVLESWGLDVEQYRRGRIVRAA